MLHLIGYWIAHINPVGMVTLRHYRHWPVRVDKLCGSRVSCQHGALASAVLVPVVRLSVRWRHCGVLALLNGRLLPIATVR